MWLLIKFFSSSLWFFRSLLHKGFFTLYSSFLIILTLHLSFIWDFTWVSIPSDTSSDSLWVVVTKISLFRCLLHVNATRKVVTVHLMWWQQLFLISFGLSHLLFKSVGHVLLFWASWKVPLAVWDTNLRYAGHVQENFPPQTFLHVLLTYEASCWAFTLLAISSDVLLSSNRSMAQHIILGPYPHNIYGVMKIFES